MVKTEASASGGGSREDRGIYGGGYGSGGTSIGFPNIFQFPFGGLVPQVTTWGEGSGCGGFNNNPGACVNCQFTHNVFPMHYVITPVYFQPMDPASQNNRRRDGPGDMAPGPSPN
ncbi:hypothetical protein L1987_58646 [Smallanthus sonchifolius]|uniref:Uncharacterized protein n=1 Tax=Smallanthus sonchifolius TaxID=185202 RepID=A0ACB9DG65_9ASTR|nr:hypothetical protein L1987_58646 [Smallanthus sonchifolius]